MSFSTAGRIIRSRLVTLRDEADTSFAIRGKTGEARTARVLAGVQVEAFRWHGDELHEPVPDWAESDVSDAEGHFVLSHLPRGEFRLRLDLVGYQVRGRGSRLKATPLTCRSTTPTASTTSSSGT